MYTLDSRNIQPGDTFICLPGGEAYIDDARSRGAADVRSMDRQELGRWATEHFGHPSRQLKVVGITGTNGKTTVSHLVSQALNLLGKKAYVLGTINSPLTTPESLDVQRLMAEHLEAGGTHFIMEVSSHAIDQGRIVGIDFDVKCLTNITQDHLDYHKTLEHYQATKKRFLQEQDPVHTTSTPICIWEEDYRQEVLAFESPLPGEFNRWNIMAAQAILKALGFSDAQCTASLSQVHAPEGRFEEVLEGQPYTVIIDFAHTPDGLHKILNEAKLLAGKNGGELISVFGCGGDRDRDKRPKMAAASAQYSDWIVLTQDNPRTEDLHGIMDDVLTGIPNGYTHYQVEHDRRQAINAAIQRAKPNDVVVVAGRGHEKVQIVGTQEQEFSDRDVARDAILARQKG